MTPVKTPETAATCRHCGSPLRLLLLRPATGEFSCLPCIREKEPAVYAAVVTYIRDNPPEKV